MVGHPDADPGLAQGLHMAASILLAVGDHEVGGELDDAADVGVLGAAYPFDVQVGRVSAPHGRADQQVGPGMGEGLGQLSYWIYKRGREMW